MSLEKAKSGGKGGEELGKGRGGEGRGGERRHFCVSFLSSLHIMHHSTCR